MKKHIHIIGICGTFMGGLALLAREAGFTVTGSDQNIYPPMSTLLIKSGISMYGYSPENLEPRPDAVIIGNALSRGNSEVEAVLNLGIPYYSGPDWLARHILRDRWVLAVSGTHGKTSTSAMLAWILHYADMNPGFLIGGVPENFGVSAQSGLHPFFVIEADEYDTAFFDKRAKFVHYRPRTLLINNIEFDHADIFTDLSAIKTQFHHLVRTVPEVGLIAYPSTDRNVQDVIDIGCWSKTETLNDLWQTQLINADGSSFKVSYNGKGVGIVDWSLFGEHNVANALGAIVAARHAGVPVEHAINALGEFKGILRRMQLRDVVGGVSVYDDFAHHPTAIKTTISGLRRRVQEKRIIAIVELRSNTMKMGVLKEQLSTALSAADLIYVLQGENIGWQVKDVVPAENKYQVLNSTEEIVDKVTAIAQAEDHILIMSNGDFDNIHDRLIYKLRAR